MPAEEKEHESPPRGDDLLKIKHPSHITRISVIADAARSGASIVARDGELLPAGRGKGFRGRGRGKGALFGRGKQVQQIQSSVQHILTELASQHAQGPAGQHPPGIASQHAAGPGAQHPPGMASQHAQGPAAQHPLTAAIASQHAPGSGPAAQHPPVPPGQKQVLPPLLPLQNKPIAPNPLPALNIITKGQPKAKNEAASFIPTTSSAPSKEPSRRRVEIRSPDSMTSIPVLGDEATKTSSQFESKASDDNNAQPPETVDEAVEVDLQKESFLRELTRFCHENPSCYRLTPNYPEECPRCGGGEFKAEWTPLSIFCCICVPILGIPCCYAFREFTCTTCGEIWEYDDPREEIPTVSQFT